MFQEATPQLRQRRATRYEVTATAPDGSNHCIGFTARQSRRGLLNVLQSRGQDLIDLTAMGDADEIEFHTRPRIHAAVTNGWQFGFTGRTERQCLTTEGNA